MTQTPFFSTLKNRGIITIRGQDRESFLQSLISNDIALLKTQDCVYACLLSPQGKFLYDFFLTVEQDTILIDCEGGQRTDSLAKILNMYKLRADVDITYDNNTTLYEVIGAQHGYKDPRHPDIGYRSRTKPKNIEEKPFSSWDKHRISLTIPDGSRDMIIQKSTLLECNIDKLNGLSFDKGCYIGQELTARMHYRGLAKKHLYTITPIDITAEKLPECDQTITKNGKNIGVMRSSCDDLGLAILKDAYAPN